MKHESKRGMCHVTQALRTRFVHLRKKNFLIETMSLALGTVNNSAIDDLVQSSLESKDEDLRLEWIPCSEFTDKEPTQIDNVYYASRKQTLCNGEMTTMLLICLGNSGECTQTLVSEFARIYSLPTHKYKNDVNQFRRHSVWLKNPTDS